jgi:2-dehydropantoate 2-reductase
MSMNPVSVLTGADTATMLADRDVRRLLADMMLEMQMVGERIGLPLVMTPDERFAVAEKMGSFRTSMLNDAAAGRPLEYQPIIGSVAEIAEKVGVPVPSIRAVLGLVRVRAQTIERVSSGSG